MLRELWIHFGKCPNKSEDLMGALPTMSLATKKQGSSVCRPPCLHIYMALSVCFLEVHQFYWRDCHASVSLQSGMVGTSKNRRTTAKGNYFFLTCLEFVFNKTAMLQGNIQKMPEKRGDMVGNRPRGSPCFLLTGDRWISPIKSPLLFEHFQQCIFYSVSIIEKVSNTLRHFPKSKSC